MADPTPPPRRSPSGPRSSIASRILLRDPPSNAPPLLVKPVHDFKHTGRYRVLGEFARGGIGVILKGHDEDLGRDVAMKVLRDEHLKNPQVVERFVEEAQIGGQLQHPGIVPVYELGTGDDERPFFTMKLVKGRTLSALLQDRRDLAEDRRRFLSIFEAVCLTIAYAHSRGVIHRDLKPSNIMVGAFGEVQVVDWGLAKVLGQGGIVDERRARDATTSIIMTVRSSDVGSQSLAGSVFGTPSYMPPEQAQGFVDQVDERGDVFALGAILCEILTGKPPYPPGEGDALDRAARGDLADARARLAACGADEELLKLANDCLQFLANDRPRSAEQVATRIGAWIAAVEQRVHQARIAAADARARVRGLLLMLVALALFAMAGFGWWWIDAQARDRRAAGSRTVRAELENVVAMRTMARNAAPGTTGVWEHALAVARGAEKLALTVEIDAETRARAAALRGEIEVDADAARKDAERDAADRAMVERLQELRGTENDPGFTTHEEFAAAFRDHGIDVTTLPVADSVEKIRTSRIHDALAIGLDYWAAIEEPRAALLLEIATAADPDPWRSKLRKAKNVEELRALARSADVATFPVESLIELLYALGARDAIEPAIAVGERAALVHPDDFSIRTALASMHERAQPPQFEDALRHAVAAIALRPQIAFAWRRAGLLYAELDRAQRLAGRPDAGDDHLPATIDCFRRAVDLKPHDALSRLYLAMALSTARRFDEAVVECDHVLAVRPTYANVLMLKGYALLELGRAQTAVTVLRQATRQFGNRTDASPAGDLVSTTALLAFALLRAGDLDGANTEAERALALDPGESSAFAHAVRGSVRARRGDVKGGRSALAEAVRFEPKEPDLQIELGRLELDDMRHVEAAAAFRAALSVERDSAAARLGLGVALRRNGELDAAIDELTAATRLAPGDAAAFLELGLAQRERGRLREAVDALRKGGDGAKTALADTERLLALEPKLLRTLGEKGEPADARDAVDLARLCAIRRLNVAATGYFTRAFALEPGLAEELAAGRRFEAARAAAQAACGRGDDAESLDAAARAQLGADALAWLRDDLVLHGEAIETGSEAEAAGSIAGLKLWLAEPALAPLREEAALAQLPAAERAEWSALWTEVRDRLERARGE